MKIEEKNFRPAGFEPYYNHLVACFIDEYGYVNIFIKNWASC